MEDLNDDSMLDGGETAPETPATPAEAMAQAWNRSGAGYEWDGRVLERFTLLRQTAAMTMGMRHGTVRSDELITVEIPDEEPEPGPDGQPAPVPPAEDGEEKPRLTAQIYPQLIADVSIVLWLCLQPDYGVYRAIRKPQPAYMAALKWADGQGINLGSAKFGQATKVFSEIMEDIATSLGNPAPEKAGKAPHPNS